MTTTAANIRRKKPRLNDLSGKDWLTHSKTTVLNNKNRASLKDIKTAIEHGALLSEAPQRSGLKKDHPATFSEKDIARLLRFFTREDSVVLDPFLGSGSTAIACIAENRRCIGFELYNRWCRQARARVKEELAGRTRHRPRIRHCDALSGLSRLTENSIDFIVTSPPYWSILEKKDHKARNERLNNHLPTDYGNHAQDLSTIPDYGEFLNALDPHFAEYRRVLKDSAYVAIIVSDFRHAQRYYLFHADIAARLEKAGFTIQGLIVLIQDNKKLYPYGYPTSFVPNISNQYIVVGRNLT